MGLYYCKLCDVSYLLLIVNICTNRVKKIFYFPFISNLCHYLFLQIVFLLQPNGPQSEQLRHVQVWKVNRQTCAQRYVIVGRPITENMLCSGWLDVGGRDQCAGDSGGPLYYNGVIVGICSFGWSCAVPFFPGVNARVSRYPAWISQHA